MSIQKIKAGRVTQVVADEWVGPYGTLFYNEDLGDLRVGDGVTPGGILLAFGGGEGGNYSLPTATTTVKGGIKIDGTTIAITNQVIRVGTVPYSSLSGTPTIPTNNNQLTNGAAYITSAALSGLATETYVTTRGYLTTVAYADVTGKPTLFSGSYADLTNKPTLFSGSYADLTNKPTIPTNNNELTNGAAYITSAALSGLASETYVTTRGYITSAALNTYAISSSIPTDISQLTDTTNLLGTGGGGGGTTYITNTVENPFSFSVAGDDSTLREIANGESIKITGAGGIAVTTDAEGNVTVTGTPVSLAGYATETYVTSQGYITGLSFNDLTDKPNLAGTYSWSIAGDDSTLREISAGESVKFIGAGGITTASDAEGNITITGSGGSSLGNLSVTGNSLGFYTEGSALGFINFNNAGTGLVVGNNLAGSIKIVTSGLDAGGKTWTFGETGTLTFPNSTVQTTAWTGSVAYANVTGTPTLFSGSYNDLTDRPNLAGTYQFSVAADDSTQRLISTDEVIKFTGAGGITTASDAEGAITITGPDLSTYATQSYVTTALSNSGIIVSTTAPAGQPEGKLWYNSASLELYVRYDSAWVAASASFSGDYNDLTNRPTNVSQFANDANYVSRDEVYLMILELTG